jgi:hypothetical protein
MPPLEPRLKLTVISAFFNDWRTMLTDTTRFGSSYWSLPVARAIFPNAVLDGANL